MENKILEEIIQMVSSEPNNPEHRAVLTDTLNAIMMHKVHKKLGTYKGIWFGPGLLKDECGAVLQAYIQIEEGEKKSKLIQDLEYWNANYEEISKVWN
jgi:hypothetical protein